MIVLGIETSCDETGIALYSESEGLLTEALFSQIDMHRLFGGVVPELASRDHIKRALPLIKQVMQEAVITSKDLDGIAYTTGPGLVGALLVGAALGKSLAWAWDKPSIGIHHMEGHLLAPMLAEDKPSYPFVALLVSGGHTQLISVRQPGCYELLGDTLDDAVGEAFDKTAKLLGLFYPGGPEIAKLAEHGQPDRFKFPRPMTDRPGLDMSFSGLKTYSLNTIEKLKQQASGLSLQDKSDIALAFQTAAVDTLAIKCQRALKRTGFRNLVVAGGVSANTALRSRLNQMTEKLKGQVYFPPTAYCTDNGAMIAYAGLLRLKKQQGSEIQSSFAVRPRWPLAELPPL